MSTETRTSSVTGQIADTCTVLVVGGGPGGSYAAAALAREGIDVVLLEADVFPRYHIGESMLASLRHLLRFIDLDSTFDEYGFTKKVGAAFKMNGHKRHGYTDFLAAGGPDNYAWNVVRADADDLMFRHAGKCGAKIFDGVKVSSVAFSTDAEPPDSNARPISARWTRSSDGTSGEIKFRYIIDASGRAGLLCTKYLKNRMYNQGLKNVASWAYWKGAGAYAAGTARANSPFFEALVDESGWAWLIPLHNGKTSVGIVMNQEISSTKRNSRLPVPSAREFYLEQLKLAPELLELLGDAELASPPDDGPQVKSASDYSYSASSYAAPGLRVVGDAGCFIDPFFSSGVHLALTGALSAAVTICAVLRGECSEDQAVKWHSNKVGTSYTRFLVVVLSAYKQMRAQDAPVLADFDEDNFDRAFAFFRPIIQGTADVNLGERLSQAELAKTLDFCSHAFEPTLPEEHEAVFSKLNGTGHEGVPLSGTLASNHQTTSEPPANTHLVAAKSSKMDTPGAMTAYNTNLTAAEQAVLTTINARKVLRFEDTITVESFETDTIDGLRPRLECGRLGLISA